MYNIEIPNKKKIVASIECRMTSKRLPGKVLLEACGKPMLELQVERLRRVEAIDEIVFATTINTTDDPIVDLANRINIPYFRGSEQDVLKRVLETHKKFNSEIIVEITGDCPLVDPNITSQIIKAFLRNDCDYASNLDPVSFPIGFDTQVFPIDLLILADQESNKEEDREHVSWFIRRQPERFKKLHIPAPQELEWPELALTLDEMQDYELINNIFKYFYDKNKEFSIYDIVWYLRENRKIVSINKDVERTKIDY